MPIFFTKKSCKRGVEQPPQMPLTVKKHQYCKTSNSPVSWISFFKSGLTESPLMMNFISCVTQAIVLISWLPTTSKITYSIGS